MPVFKSLHPEGPGLRQVSRLFQEHFKLGHVRHIGFCHRDSFLRNKAVENTSFRSFLEEKGLPLPTGYGVINPSLDAEYKSLSKYDKPPPDLDPQDWLLATQWMYSHFGPYMMGSKIATQEEAITETDKSTSPGYPWNRRYRTKAEMLNDPVSSPAIADFWDRLASPDCVPPLWSCSQKVELRKDEKIRDNKIRTFTASPIELTIASSRVHLHMTNKFYEHSAKTWSFVGTSPFFGNWNILFRRLSKFFLNGFALDESDYDASLFIQAFIAVRNFVWDNLAVEDKTPENQVRIWNIYNFIIFSVIVTSKGELLRKFLGNCSGGTETIKINTMVLFMLKAYSFIRTARAAGKEPTYDFFMSNVEAVLNGDDNTFTVSDEVLPFYNATSIKKEWDAIGITTKTDDYNPRPVKDLDFLSHTFHYDTVSHTWVPRPDSSKILCSLLYGSDLDDVRFHLLRAAALYITSYYNEECRNTIRMYMEWLLNVYGSEMKGWIYEKQIRAEDVFQSIKSDLWIQALYTGYEQASEHPLVPILESPIIIVPYAPQKEMLICSEFRKNPALHKNSPAISQTVILQSSMPKKHSKSHSKKKVVVVSHKRKHTHVAKHKGGGGSSLASTAGTVASTIGKAVDFAKPFAKLFGFGDYRMRAAQMNASGAAPGVFNHSGVPIITHREYIRDITGSTDFDSFDMTINPGNINMFPWLAQIAMNFEEYEFDGLMFYFKSLSGEAIASTNTGLGEVIMSTEYDTMKPPFANKSEMENYEFTTNCKPAEDMYHPIECSPKLTPVTRLFVDNGAVNDYADRKFYDLGRFTCATVGQQSVNTIGELWVSYKIKLIKPRITRSISTYSWARFGGFAIGGPGNFLMGMPRLEGTLDVVPTFYKPAATQYSALQFNRAGRFLVFLSYGVTATPSYVTNSGWLTTGNSTIIPMWATTVGAGMTNPTSQCYNNAAPGNGLQRYTGMFCVQIDKPGDMAYYTDSWTAGVFCYGDMLVLEFPNLELKTALPRTLQAQIDGYLRNRIVGSAVQQTSKEVLDGDYTMVPKDTSKAVIQDQIAAMKAQLLALSEMENLSVSREAILGSP